MTETKARLCRSLDVAYAELDATPASEPERRHELCQRLYLIESALREHEDAR